MYIFAHRGFSGEYPENTMLAFDKAVEAGADGIETDVQLTKDLVPVIMHDEMLDRTTDGHGFVGDYTYDELSKLNAGYTAKFGEKYASKPERIPTLDEFLRWMAHEATGITTNIELKNSLYYYAGMEERVISMICEYGLEDRIILSSFNNASIRLCKEIDPDIRCGFLIDPIIGNPGAYCREMGVEYYHPNFDGELGGKKFPLTEEQVKNCSQNGIGVNVWTVNTKEDIRRMKKWGVNAVIGNYPDRGIEVNKE